MGIEKTGVLILTAVIAVLLGIAIWESEDRRSEPEDGPRQLLVDGDIKALSGQTSGVSEGAGHRREIDLDDRETPPNDRYRRVKVKSGETLSKIARDVYGDGRLYHLLIKGNPDIDPNRLKVGTELIVPPRDNREGTRSNRRRSRDSESARSKPQDREREQTVNSERVHLVKRNETLSGIAKRYYRSSRHWRRILDANRDRLRSENHLQPGMRLRIPN